MMTRVKAASQYLLMSYVIAVSIVGGWFASDVFLPPIELRSMTVTNPDDLVAGGELRFTVEYYRNRLCKTEANRFIVEQLGSNRRRVLYRDSVNGTMEMGLNQSEAKIIIPRTITMGSYFLQDYLTSECTLINRVDKYPDVILHIKPAS